MKILHTADWHIGNFPGPENDGMNLRSQDTQNCIEHLIDTARNEKSDLIVISGDLFHQARVWADRGLSEVQTAIVAIEKLSTNAHVVVLRGTPNHDGSEQFALLKAHFENSGMVNIVTEPTVLNLYANSKPINVACLPGFDRGVFRAKFPGLSKEEENQVFSEELGKIVLALKAQCDNSQSILLSHYTVPGCNTESGQTQFLAQFEPVIMPEIIDAAGFDLTALGHIHRPQQVSSCSNTYYAGAINAMNFNDEGQERGFWLHDLADNSHEFFKTPYREFVTFEFTDTDIVGINTGEIEAVAHNWWTCNDGIRDKIVRVIYSCSEEANKSFNKSLLEKKLYEDGAFWVSEISPEKISISANRNNLSDKSDPVANLIQYLDEKAYTDEQIKKIVEASTPIIDETVAGAIISRLSGIFEPVSIEVRNYRNYTEESFNFNDITFCTINGKNGAGKSSLFMDAILDCLYEEPREGDLTGWIRADDEARSGSISFTFRIGDKQFRVTRTRAKSGKATLSLSESVDGDWENRSKEKYKDTQEEIINILGMDSLTFKSCALIMQDQYGLFLQADKESRMTILSNILGLGIYGDMEALSKLKSTDANREIGQMNTEISKLALSVANEDDIELSLCEANQKVKELTLEVTALTADKEKYTAVLSGIQEASIRAEKILNDVNTLKAKKADAEAQRTTQQDIIENAELVLSMETQILEGVNEHNLLLEKEKQLISAKSTYQSKVAEGTTTAADIAHLIKSISDCDLEIGRLNEKHSGLEIKLKREPELAEYHAEALVLAQQMNEYQLLGAKYLELVTALSESEKQLGTAKASYNKQYAEKASEIKNLKTKMELLENSDCIDSENANCRFLADATQAKKLYEPMLAECTSWKETELVKIAEIERKIAQLQSDKNSSGYKPEERQIIQNKIISLEPLSQEYQNLSSVKEQITLIFDSIEPLKIRLSDLQERLTQAQKKADTISSELSKYQEEAKSYDAVVLKISSLKRWLDKEKLLPVSKERKTTAEQRIAEINNLLSEIALNILDRQAEYEKELQALNGKDEIVKQINTLQEILTNKQIILNGLQNEIGSLTTMLDIIHRDKEQTKKLQTKINALSEAAATYEVLKQAFSPDGIPHNIIRSIIPQLTATANSILGQMTGGKMGMEFRTEKVLKSNNKKEVVTLDIFIEEYGKGSLPYLSKSGGEKVKSALSAILSLAEIKSTSAGIQLGMLFIDEPPFLDGDGIQAYCDALETIQQRYSNLKIMAITHDPTMKARFPQNLDVIKTESGSKVVFE